MNNNYPNLCDDFGLYSHLNTELPLPTGRETVLHFFETIKKSFPKMTNFFGRENGEFVLEEDKDTGSHRSVVLEQRRLCSGCVNPDNFTVADKQHLLVLEQAPYHFDISGLDVEALDVQMAFDFVCNGNHDEVVAEALGVGPGLDGLLNLRGSQVVKYEPSLMLTLDHSMRLLCRLNIETRTTAYQVRAGQFQDDPITVFFTVRQYWQGEPIEHLGEAYKRQRQLLQELVDEQIVPQVIQPLAQVISGK